MSIFFTIIIFLISIFLTQIFGGKKIFYIRFISFVFLYLSLFFLVYYFIRFDYFLINFLLSLSLIFAWSGFIIHISNSIFLSLLKLIHDNKISNYNELLAIYNQNEKFRIRLNTLCDGGFLIRQKDNFLFNYNYKKILLLKLIIFLKD